MGWLTDLTEWFRQQLQTLWDAIEEFFGDLVVKVIEAVCDFFATVVEAIPVPDWVTTYSLDTLLGAAGPTIGWLVATFKIGEGLGVLALGIAFRLLRKLFTLGQW